MERVRDIVRLRFVLALATIIYLDLMYVVGAGPTFRLWASLLLIGVIPGLAILGPIDLGEWTTRWCAYIGASLAISMLFTQVLLWIGHLSTAFALVVATIVLVPLLAVRARADLAVRAG